MAGQNKSKVADFQKVAEFTHSPARKFLDFGCRIEHFGAVKS